MISASHNPHEDNGIKFFGPDGFKLSDEAEAEIEAIVAGEILPAQPQNIGRAKRIEDGRGRYQEFVKTTFPSGVKLDGLKVVVDCANGAAYGGVAQWDEYQPSLRVHPSGDGGGGGGGAWGGCGDLP